MNLVVMVLEKAEVLYDYVEKAFSRAVFVHTLPSIAPNRLQLIRVFRRTVKLSVLLALGLVILATTNSSAKLLQIAGMLLDLAGIARIFIDEEWDSILSYYADEKEFPYGPPSHVTREMFQDDNPDTLGDIPEAVETMARHLYWRRGLVLVILGFTLQLVGTALG